MQVCITSIKKIGGSENPHAAISEYGWLNESNNDSGIANRIEMVQWHLKPENLAYVKSTFKKVYCYINESVYGTKFLQTYATERDNLLKLPQH